MNIKSRSEDYARTSLVNQIFVPRWVQITTMLKIQMTDPMQHISMDNIFENIPLKLFIRRTVRLFYTETRVFLKYGVRIFQQFL